jgi:predicted phosphohydrolase
MANPFRLAWLTDVHLDHVDEVGVGADGREVRTTDMEEMEAFRRLVGRADAVLVTGDVSTAPRLRWHLQALASHAAPAPLYYVLGNHDYYFGSISQVREDLRRDDPALWLGRTDYVGLTDDAALVGHDGWYDGGYADWFRSKIVMTDYDAIRELRLLPPLVRHRRIDELSRESAGHIEAAARKAVADGYEAVYVATHVPPFAAASRAPDGSPSDADWLPLMSSKHVGDALRRLADDYPAVRFEALCGHTHTRHELHVAKNLVCRVGGARYGAPWVSLRWLEVG